MAGSRSQARFCAVQALYQLDVGGGTPEEIERQFLQRKELKNADLELFNQLLFRVFSLREELDQKLIAHLDRPMEQIDAVEHAILLIGSYELRHCPDVPTRVAINEAIELAKKFGAEEGHKYINAVLDKIATAEREKPAVGPAEKGD